MADNLFSQNNLERVVKKSSYTAKDIEVLEGLEAVRLRPGMYIGGRDQKSMQHLIAEVLDNSFDEAVAGYASNIAISLLPNNIINIRDNGRGIPIDPHPKYPDQSALEVILTQLHSGGKFTNKAYQTAGGLHGVGISVVNALSDLLNVKVRRDGICYEMEFSKGKKVKDLGTSDCFKKERGTEITFHPDPEIFGEVNFSLSEVYSSVKAKAYLYHNVMIDWQVAEEIPLPENVPRKQAIQFLGGIKDYIRDEVAENPVVIPNFYGVAKFDEGSSIECAISWLLEADGRVKSYCNTINTQLGGVHEQGVKSGINKSIKSFAEKISSKKYGKISSEDIQEGMIAIISVFVPQPEFQGQTKEKLVNRSLAKSIENLISDLFDHFLASNSQNTEKLLDYFALKAEDRLARKSSKDAQRKTVLHKLTLPGKLADCSKKDREGTELFLVEGDSAGGSAKQARNREFQAILPLRGKILNIASSTAEKLSQNQQLKDIEQALGIAASRREDLANLRYEKIIIMTDADVDGAHIASLLLTFFYLKHKQLILNGNLYIAKPPLFRVLVGTKSYYVNDEREKERLLAKLQNKRSSYTLSRFKGLGEMTAEQLKETTMNPHTRTLFKVHIDEVSAPKFSIEDLMGKNPEHRFRFIREKALENKEYVDQLLDL